MPRLNVYAGKSSELAETIRDHGTRTVNEFACTVLIRDGVNIEKAQQMALAQISKRWPERRGQTTQHIKVQVKPEAHDRLLELSKTLGLSMSRTTLVWLQLAAQAMHQSRTQASAPPLSSQSAQAGRTKVAPTARPDTPTTEQVARIDFGGIYPPAPGEQVLTRVKDGHSETWLHCRMHKDMTADQVRDIGNAGAMWVDSDIYQAVMEQKLNLNQMMALVMQRRAPVGNSSLSGQAIELPKPARAGAQASSSTATDTGFGLDAVAWMAQAASVWDKQP